MNLSTTEAFSLNKLQQCHYDLKLNEATSVEKVTALMGTLSQVGAAHTEASISRNGVSQLTRQYWNIICSLVDSQTEVNNYGQSTFNLCSRYRNENQQEWKSSFTHRPRPTCCILQHESIQKLCTDTENFEMTQLNKSTVNIRKNQQNVLQNHVVSQRQCFGTIGMHVSTSHQRPYSTRNGNTSHEHQCKKSNIGVNPNLSIGLFQTANSGKRIYNIDSEPCSLPSNPKDYTAHKKVCLFGEQTKQSGTKRKIKDVNNDGFKITQSKEFNFVTAKSQLLINQDKNDTGNSTQPSMSHLTSRKVLGTRRGLNSKFIPPVSNKSEQIHPDKPHTSARNNQDEEPVDERLKNIDPRMIELVMNEVMDSGPLIQWDDIAGLEFAKSTIKEIVVWPMLRPDIFHGLRGPPKGLLLFGPPGTGKTLIGKCIANQSGATFFSISASSLTSKWIGEGEKMVRALFAVARCHQPAVIFIDEIDSLLSQRSADEHESSRRIKTEFLVQLDGATTKSEDRLLVVGATNRPQEIDEAARRRLVKRLYIPLPDSSARKQIVLNLLTKQDYKLTENELQIIQENTEGYSGADVANVCREAALGPVRCIKDIEQVSADQVRPMIFMDFQAALKTVRASVSQHDLKIYLEWNKQYGSGS